MAETAPEAEEVLPKPLKQTGALKTEPDSSLPPFRGTDMEESHAAIAGVDSKVNRVPVTSKRDLVNREEPFPIDFNPSRSFYSLNALCFKFNCKIWCLPRKKMFIHTLIR